MKHLLFLSCFLLLLLVLPSSASAHGLRIEYTILEDKVEIRAEFDDGTRAQKAKVTVANVDKKTIAAGETDAKGAWMFAKPKPGVYRVIVNAGDGHVEHVDFQIADPTQPVESVPTTGTNRKPDTAAGHSLKIAIGVGVIGLLGVALLIASRQQRGKKNKSPSNGEPGA